jgi:hypothetical protein
MYVVYHIHSTQRIKQFAKESAAKRSTTCMNRNANYPIYKDATPVYAYTTLDNYETNVVVTKKVINLMSGKEIAIPSNTPNCCDPSSETYWSM